MIKFFWLAVLLLPSLGFAQIVQIGHISDILRYDEEGTVYFFDIDNTLLKPKQVLGSDQWFRYVLDKYVKTMGIPADRATGYALDDWGRVLNATEVEPVEPSTVAVIEELQNRGRLMAALTARESNLEETTRKQLLSAPIDFEKTSIAKNQTISDGVQTAVYDGVIHLGHGGDKGVAAVDLLDALGIVPTQIIFADDRQPNVDQFNVAMLKYIALHPKVKYKCLRYGYLDALVAAFDPQIAEKEWDYFQKTGKLKDLSAPCKSMGTLQKQLVTP